MYCVIYIPSNNIQCVYGFPTKRSAELYLNIFKKCDQCSQDFVMWSIFGKKLWGIETQLNEKLNLRDGEEVYFIDCCSAEWDIVLTKEAFKYDDIKNTAIHIKDWVIEYYYNKYKEL